MSAGLYVHVPFCLTRCGYCDFNAYAGLGHLAERYGLAVQREADIVSPTWRGTRIDTVFLGGGTPTTLPSETLSRVLGHLRRRFTVASDAEVTVEANPDTVDERSLACLLEGGFNRMSMGVQSFDPDVLRALERIHGPTSAREAFAAARRAGFANLNLDLIYGALGESVGSWRRTLHEAIRLGPDHLSCYALTVEPATPLGRKVAARAIPAPDGDVQAQMFDVACDLLADAGYVHYEVSNWARPGLECRHNFGYWRRRPYAALGAGAHGYRDGLRWWNLRPPLAYLAAVEAGSLPVAGEERLSDEAARLEEVFLALRTSEGLPLEGVEGASVVPLFDEGLAVRRGGRLVLTERGMFLANDIALAVAG